jgi:hypothetical protein
MIKKNIEDINDQDKLSLDDFDNLDIEDIEIEIDDLDELDLEELDELEDELETNEDDLTLSKHKEEGKHSLKYDSIFKGKKEDPLSEEEYMGGYDYYYKESIEVDKSSQYHHESIDNESYVREKLVKEKVYEVLKNHTDLNFTNNRRKPSKIDFNTYYELLRTKLNEESFTNVEIFNELSFYFSDNILNMFKLLDSRWRNMVLKELEEHIGKSKTSKEIKNRNIYEGTEIEFIWADIFDNEKLITGVVVSTNYEESKYKVDSYENIYEIGIENITKILNNEKFKYNLNKLNNIDFL